MTYSYKLIKKQKGEVNPANTSKHLTFVETETWNNIPASENMTEDSMPKVLGISQITHNDFLQALNDIRSIAIKNVDKMIEYAENYGRSLRNGDDIRQLEEQASIMPQSQKGLTIIHSYSKILQTREDTLKSLNNSLMHCLEHMLNKDSLY
jgi:hypothetical protein